MRLKWFIIGATAASLIWLAIMSSLGLQWINALFGR
jgi:arginine exporter protein ArgO